MNMIGRETIDLEQGWEIMQEGIKKLINILEGVPEQRFNFREYMELYTTIYVMCTQKPPHDYSQRLYNRYRESFEDYITAMVLPALWEQQDELMLRELVKRWGNHRIMVRWLSSFFQYLDKYYVKWQSLPTLNEVGLTCFRDLVYHEIRNNIKDAMITLIDREREGEQIDRALLKNVLGIFVDIGMDIYKEDFEVAMLEDTASYYSRRAASWILEYSSLDYMHKATECLKQEKERVAHYLHSSSEHQLLEIVQNELLSRYENQLLEKEHSACHALLRDDKMTPSATSTSSRLDHSVSTIVELGRPYMVEMGGPSIFVSNQPSHPGPVATSFVQESSSYSMELATQTFNLSESVPFVAHEQHESPSKSRGITPGLKRIIIKLFAHGLD